MGFLNRKKLFFHFYLYFTKLLYWLWLIDKDDYEFFIKYIALKFYDPWEWEYGG